MGEITSLIIPLVYIIAGTIFGATMTYIFSQRTQRKQEDKKKREVAYFFKNEIELNVSLIRLFRKNLTFFREKGDKIAQKVQVNKVYNSSTFSMLPELDPALLTKIRAFYCLKQLKIESLSHSSDNFPQVIEALANLEGWPKIGKERNEGWEDLEKVGVEIIESLDEVCT